MKSRLLLFMVCLTMATFAQKSQKMTQFVIHTPMGDMKGVLYNDTPLHRDNFVKLVKEGWYTDSPWHRVINSFMIQGGGHKDGRTDPGYTVPAEFNASHFHKKGALAAARMGDQVNPQRKSSGSQFYVVQGQKLTPEMLAMYEQRMGVKFTEAQKKAYAEVGGTPHLDGTYTVFGEITEGLEVIDKIAAVKTGPGDKPVSPVGMTIEILK
ncbi:MAG: peptidylprolyl isomerase [Bacteroidales bacterium]|nr:peptidylprolyl isomerase [Bacteroidales bacterium]MDD3664231.1 peptidylprolyl isomerase [Bacteroidales bacterium]